MSESAYRRLTFELSPAGEDALLTELWSLGTLGVEIRRHHGGELLAEAYFETGSSGGDAAAELEDRAFRLLADEPLPARDWLADYRRQARPIEVGRTLLVDPAEPEGASQPQAAPPGRTLLRLPAREAFGTGSHESTRLAVELMEEMTLEGRTILDLGTGTGILAFAAMLLGAARVVALEIDPVAALMAGENRRLNGAPVAIVAGSLETLAAPARFDVALINILPERIESRLERLPRLLARGGEVVFSGILATLGERLLERLAGLGFALRAERSLGEWVAYRLERAA